jgi:hypothetical protein
MAGCDNGGNSTGNEPPITPSCTTLSLDTPFLNKNNKEEFFIFLPENGTLDVRVLSDGTNVFLIVSDGQTVFGFTGVPLDSGSSCALISASVDFNFDGFFDETTVNFISDCSILDEGAKLLLLSGRSSVEASDQLKEKLLIFYNQILYFDILNGFDCSNSEAVSSAGICESLLSELKSQVSQ